jgi:hypothetical protein
MHKIPPQFGQEAITLLKPEEFQNQSHTEINEQQLTSKRPFVEPEITTPVDVLEATTFFQAVTSGVTN